MVTIEEIIIRRDTFFSKVEFIGECFEFQGHKIKGYPMFPVRHEGRSYTGAVKASRASWRLFIGEIPDGLYVLHSCDNRACVRPDHLFLGTAKDNYEDSRLKGRNVSGERCCFSKLTEDQVVEIRNKYASGGYLIKALAKEYGIHRSHAAEIITRKKWANIQ